MLTWYAKDNDEYQKIATTQSASEVKVNLKPSGCFQRPILASEAHADFIDKYWPKKLDMAMNISPMRMLFLP